MAFTITSPAFADGERIPKKYTAEGENVSPPLEWTDPPAGTKGFALLVEDPDTPVGTLQHWAIYDIPGSARSLPENASATAPKEALNYKGRRHYSGPMPPVGHGVHRYRFRLAALDVESLDLPEDADWQAMWDAADRHRLGETVLTGLYSR